MIDEPTREIMPMLNALRKAKLRVSLAGDSARVSFRAGEAHDLVTANAQGRLALGDLVAEVHRRLEGDVRP